MNATIITTLSTNINMTLDRYLRMRFKIGSNGICRLALERDVVMVAKEISLDSKL